MKQAKPKLPRLYAIRPTGGFGLVELMIGMTIGLILLLGIGYLFIGSQRTFRTQDDFSRIQESMRYALDQMATDVRMAGYAGCVNLASIDPNDPTAPIPINVIANGAPTLGLEQALRGYATAAWSAPGVAPAGWVGNTGVLHITRASAQGVNLTGNMTVTNANIQINGNPAGFVAEQALLISDCVSADLLRATNVSGGGTVTIAHSITNCANIGMACNTSVNLSKAYNSDAEVFTIQSTTYFIATNAAGNPALFRRGINNVAEEMVENVEDIVMRFGVDTDNDFAVDNYVTPAAVVDWRQVLTVRLNLIFHSNSDNVATQIQPYVVEGTAVTPTDKRLRQVATATIGLRNRLP